MNTDINNTSGLNRDGGIHERVLKFSETPFARFTNNTNQMGTYVIGNKLYDNGSVVAVSAQSNPQVVMGDEPMFGEVKLVTEGKVINILLDDYNTLYNYGLVEGYNHGLLGGHKYFDPWDVYRVFETAEALDIANQSDAVTYVRDHDNGTLTFHDGNDTIVWEELPYLLYNNVIGEPTHNVEDSTNTVTHINSPHLSVRHFNPRIKVGESIKVPVLADNHFADYVNGRTSDGELKQEVTGPYTLELRIEDDDETLVRKTIYAGESMIETPVFDAVGETWFTIRCIDPDGVGSPVHYLDVMVESTVVEESKLEVTDEMLRDPAFDIYPDDLIKDGDTRMVKAWRNKKGLTELFAYAKREGYTAVELPKHNYLICDYKNQGDADSIALHNDEPVYWYCEVNAVEENGVVTSNSVSVIEQLTEEQVIADVKGVFRYKWFNDNFDYIVAAITYEQDALIEKYMREEGLSESAARAKAEYNAPIPASRQDFGDHYNDIVYPTTRIGSFHGTLPYSVRHAFDYLNQGFHTAVPYQSVGSNFGRMTSMSASTTNIMNADKELRKSGKYYFVYQGTAVAGDPVLVPSGITIDLNGSTLEIEKQYDFSSCTCILFDRCTDTHLKNGTILGGLADYDWKRSISRRAQRDPLEHAIPLTLQGTRFCSMEGLTIEGILGFTIITEPDNQIYYVQSLPNAFTPRGYSRSYLGYGMYDKKTLSLSDGSIGEQHTGVETFVMSDTSKAYGTAASDMGYINLGSDAQRPGCKDVFVGYGANGTSSKGIRQEVFIFFYDNSDKFIKAVKTKATWMVKIPQNAAKVRVMGYGHSGKEIINGSRYTDESDWNYMGVHQIRFSTGMVYKDCKIQKVRSSIVCGCEKQVIYDNVEFIDVASQNIINPNGEGSWDAITWSGIDLESGAPLAKYVTFNRCKASLTPGYLGSVSFILQGGEDVEVTNCELRLHDWGIRSGLIKNNIFYAPPGGGSVCGVQYYTQRNLYLFHKFIQWDGNTLATVQDKTGLFVDSKGRPKYSDPMDVTSGTLPFNPAVVYDDAREIKQHFRLTTVEQGNDNTHDYRNYIKFRNSKDIERYID